jgi:Protein of unknown function (DUF3102)
MTDSSVLYGEVSGAPARLDPVEQLLGAVARETVDRINREHELCQRAYGDALAHAIEAGRLLLDVKAELAHGRFMAWIERHFAGSQRTANVYMQLACAPQMPNSQDAANLTIEAALKQVTRRRPTRAPAADAAQLAQGGGSERSVIAPGARAQSEECHEPDCAWSEIEARELQRARQQLEGVQSRLDDARETGGLSRQTIAEMILRAAGDTRQAARLLDDLASNFER